MIASTASRNGHRPEATGDVRSAAREAYRQSLAEGRPLSGAALGRRFGMSDRWGRDQVTEVQRNDMPSSTVTVVAEPAAPAVPAPVATDLEETVGEDGPPEGESGAWLDSLIILAVAAVAAAASYGHMLEVAVMGGEPLWLARAFPITVDGLVVAALRRGRDGRWWLALGVAVSVAANMLSRYPELAADVGPVISAWPPIALFGTHRLLRGRGSQ